MIQTERLLLRAWRDQDLAPFARINADPEVGRYLRGRPETFEETVLLIDRLGRHWERWGYGWKSAGGWMRPNGDEDWRPRQPPRF